MGKNVHTIYQSDLDLWVNVREGNPAHIYADAEKAKATLHGKLVAREEKVEHIIHNMNGQIASRNSYGNDPTSSNG